VCVCLSVQHTDYSDDLDLLSSFQDPESRLRDTTFTLTLDLTFHSSLPL
jgi:hypothetical protein